MTRNVIYLLQLAPGQKTTGPQHCFDKNVSVPVVSVLQGVHVAQWAKRPGPPLKLEVPGSNPRGWFNSRAGNRDPFRWLETARGL